MKSKKLFAFTLIELLVVIAIVGILSGFVLVSLNSATDSANDARRKSDLSQIVKALLVYNTSNPTYPIETCAIGSTCSETVNNALGSASSITGPNNTYYTYSSDDGTSFTVSAIMSDTYAYSYDSSVGAYVSLSAINGVCGSANKTYSFTDTSYGSDTFCSTGTTTPSSPAFPDPGNTTNWSCNGQNGGSNADCSASRNQEFDEYAKRQPITINSASALTDYQVKLTVAYDTDMQPDFDDLRFTSSDGTTELSYWLESKTDSTTATIWVKIPSLASGDNTIYMYYANASATTASNGDNTFEFFDDFEGSSLDTNKWVRHWSGGSSVVSGGKVRVTGGASPNYEAIGAKINFAYPYRLRALTNFGAESDYVSIGLDGRANIWNSFTYTARIRYESTKIFHTYSEGTSNTISRATSLTSPNIIEINQKSSTTVDFYINNIKEGSCTNTGIPVAGMGPWIESLNSQYVDVQWIFYTKYTTTEPTSSFGAEQNN
ncbi:MAG: DUF2341 domain-containing protein [Candidatus Paceibacterota bacterium]